MSGSMLLSLEIPFMAFYGFLWLQSNSYWFPQELDQAFCGACQNKKAEFSQMYASGELQ